MSIVTQTNWQDCQRIADLPQVDELFRHFTEDPNNDTAVMIVREVLTAMHTAPAMLAVHIGPPAVAKEIGVHIGPPPSPVPLGIAPTVPEWDNKAYMTAIAGLRVKYGISHAMADLYYESWVELVRHSQKLEEQIARLNEHNNAPAVPSRLLQKLDASIAWLESGEVLPGTSACIGLDDIKTIRATLAAAPSQPAVPQGWKLVPVWLLERVEQSLGSFTSDEGWSQADMDTMDSVSALLAAPSQPAVPLSTQELELCRQWFERADYVLGMRLHQVQGMRVPKSVAAPSQEPVGDVAAWQRRDRNIVTGEWSEWHEDDDIEEVLDPEWAERRPLFTRPAPGVPDGVRTALEFYAGGNHFVRADADAWETVSGEPPNFWEDEANTATVEDGTIARNALDAMLAAAPSQKPAVNLSCKSTQARLAAQCGYAPAPSQPAVPQGVIYEKADSLYKRGYTDRQTGKDYDPRGCDEWQEVVDWLTPTAPSQEPAVLQGDTVEVIGMKGGKEHHLGNMRMPPRMKAREIAREQFGHFEDDDGSDAELCFGALEQLIDYMQAAPAATSQEPAVPQGWTDADSDAARLALELECLLLDTETLSVVSKWWASANEALELHRRRLATPAAPSQEPVTLTESERVRCLIKAGCIGTVKMTYDSGPYEITRTSINADRLIEAIIAALRAKEQS